MILNDRVVNKKGHSPGAAAATADLTLGAATAGLDL